MIRFTLLFALFVINFANVSAQFFQTGQDPSKINWRQINSVNFQIIYPEEFEYEAQRVSYVLNKVYDYGSKSLKHKPDFISVLLHTNTVKSNGLLAWAPKRIELFTTPHQQIYSQDWLEQLSIHEFRHFVQIDKISSELPDLIKIILGQQAAAIVTGAYLPFWFLEGDAVVLETAISNSGRGRKASFSMEYRAQLIEKGKYSFDKAYLGSYKDFVSDHYKLGYFMVGKTRELYGVEFWQDILNKTGKKPFSGNPLNSVFKLYSGVNSKNLYSLIFDSLKSKWQTELNSRQIDSITLCSKKNKYYTNYLYPEFFNDSLIFAYRKSLVDIGHFVLIDSNKKEKTILTPGYLLDESVSVHNNLIIWAERRPDLRWDHADKSVINVFNIDNNFHQSFNTGLKLFSPVVSPNLDCFLTVETDSSNRFWLTILELSTGKVLQRIENHDNEYYINPCWDETGEIIYTVCLNTKGKYLASVNIKTGKKEQLTKETYANIKNPVFKNGQIYFSSDFSGIDNLYSLDIRNRNINEIVSAAYGSDYPTVSKTGDKLLFSNYSSDGYQLATFDLNSKLNKTSIESLNFRKNYLAEKIAEQENGIPDFKFSDSLYVTSKKYPKFTGLFNFHSWAPVYIDINNNDVRPGFSIFSQNVLGTAETELGYDYEIADKTGTWKLSFNYYGFFPEISSEFTVGNRASTYYQITNTRNSKNEIVKSDTSEVRFVWNEKTINLNIRTPLNFSAGKFNRLVMPEIKYTLNNSTSDSKVPSSFTVGNFHALSYRLYFYNLLKSAPSRILPKWGQQVDIIYRDTPFAGKNLGSLFGMHSLIYLPGAFDNAGLKIYNGYQIKSFGKTQTFSNFVRNPRGYESYQNNKMYIFGVDYKIPLFNPDLSISKIAYIKRISTGLFYDYAWISAPAIDKNGIIYPNHKTFTKNSMGVDLTTEINLFRFFAPIEFGLRSIYRPEYQDFQFNLIFSVDFNGF